MNLLNNMNYGDHN